MEFDWTHSPPESDGLQQKDIAEAFEDPFNLRLLPDSNSSRESRYYMLGRSVSGAPIFCVFWTDGKKYRVIFARRMTADEETFYERKNNELTA